jgi:hypothetical protein
MFAGKRNRSDARGVRQKIGALRDDIKVISDPRARALFETAAEVIGGLEKAFHDYDKRDELAWS